MDDISQILSPEAAAGGPFLLAFVLWFGAAGAPVPLVPFVVAAGGLIRLGEINGGTTTLMAYVGIVLGDLTSYALGRFAGEPLERWMLRWRASAWLRARSWFDRYGGASLFVAHSVITSLDVPTNLIAGSMKYPLRRFLAWELSGRVTWLLLYGGAGYLAGSQWHLVDEFVRRHGLQIGLVIGLLVAVYFVLRRLRNSRQNMTAGNQPPSAVK